MVAQNKKILKIISTLNVLLLSINILFTLLNSNFFNISSNNIFKYSDYFNLKLIQKTFKEISDYLVNKYNIINKFSMNNISSFKKIIKLKRTGLFNETYHLNWLRNKLDEEFILKFDDENPDYLIYNVFSNEDMNYKYDDTIKIAIYTENIMPDINYADYIFGH